MTAVDRDTRGRFARGNPGGPGNPHASQVAKLRAALHRTVAEEDMVAMIAKLVGMARDGNLATAKLLIDRVLGPPVPADILERMERLESLLDSVET